MKLILGILLLSFTFIVRAAEVIEPAPLSIEDDGTRKIKVRSEKEVATVSTLPASHTIDGQLKLEENTVDAPKELVKTDIEIKEVSPKNLEEKIEIINVFFHHKRYLQFSFGFLDSRYDKIDSTLDNGSSLSSLRFVGDYNRNYQFGIGAEVISDTSGQKIPDNIRALQYRLFVDRHRSVSFFNDHIEWLSGLSLSMGDYGIKKRYINGLGQEVSQKLHEGLLFGLIPATGIRIYLGETGSLDLLVEYHLYFGKPQTYLGGFAFSPRVNLDF